MKRIFTVFICFFSIQLLQAQTLNDYRTSNVGSVTVTMEDISGWERYNGTTWVAATVTPAAFNFANDNEITIETGDTWSMNSNVNFTSNNNYTIIVRGGILSGGGGSPFDFDYGSGLSTVRIERSTNPSFGNWFENHNFKNLVLVGNGTNNFTFGGTGLTIANALTITNTDLSVTDFNLNTSNLTITASGNITITDDQTLTNSTLNVTFSGNNRTFNIGNSSTTDAFTMAGATGSTLNVAFSGTGGVMNIVSDDVDMTNSTINFTGTGAILNQTGDAPGAGAGAAELNIDNSSINLNSPGQDFNVQGSINLQSNSSITLLSDGGDLILNAGTAIFNAGTAGYIQLGPTSDVSRPQNQNSTFIYPIGSAANYLPVTVNSANSGGTRTFTVAVFEGATTNAQPGGPLTYKAPIVDAIWDVQVSGAAAKLVQLTFGWEAPLEGSVFNTLPDGQLGFGRYTTSWAAAVAGAGNNTTNFFVTPTGISLTNGVQNLFAIAQLNFSLPLLSRNFTAVPYNGQVRLNWTGVATDMSAYFEVQRNSNGKTDFEKIATIPVSAVGEAEYSFIDATPNKPESYYRIKITDENKKVTYTKTLKVNLGGTHFALDNLYPTVTTSQLNLLISSNRQKQSSVDIIDLLGRKVLSQNLNIGTGSQVYRLNVSRLAGGQYILQLKNGEETITGRFIKQ
ncbi:T9SS type A sorting domain-containing protein [Flavihumibacter fluvii]|uniref:T9SS type A sorting domain-containing protein n=1 Tax=Flavihumibacter fluvii TaxID=2838157 RepID=UPI001BDF0589|nr:T9SS type A sorting domain-containing protein [Flavihumibacter fluvii]ULQ52823.1 T9SS type A sorting domain-containing protein [Flavihumibacter fluvii]